MCTVLLPPGVNPIAVNKYINIISKCLAARKNPFLLCSPHRHFTVYKKLPLALILSCINPAHTFLWHILILSSRLLVQLDLPYCCFAVLLVGRSPDRSPVVSLGIFSESSDKSMCPGSTQPFEMSTRTFLGVKTAVA
jgi:hypothetical protein